MWFFFSDDESCTPSSSADNKCRDEDLDEPVTMDTAAADDDDDEDDVDKMVVDVSGSEEGSEATDDRPASAAGPAPLPDTDPQLSVDTADSWPPTNLSTEDVDSNDGAS